MSAEILIMPEELLAHYLTRLDDISDQLQTRRSETLALAELAGAEWSGEAANVAAAKLNELAGRMKTVDDNLAEARRLIAAIEFPVVEEETFTDTESQ